MDMLETYQGAAAVTEGRGRQAAQSPGGTSAMEAEPSTKGIDEDLRRGAQPGAAGRSGTAAPEASHRTTDENGEKGRGARIWERGRDLGVGIWIRGSGETSHYRHPLTASSGGSGGRRTRRGGFCRWRRGRLGVAWERPGGG
jgi:hypothetical protein